MRFPLLMSAAIGSVLAFAGCAPMGAREQAASCTDRSTSARCLLENAQTVLSSIDDPFDWSTSAVELGIAKDSNGDSPGGLDDFKAALARAGMIDAPKRRATAYGDIALGLSKLKRSAAVLTFVNAVSAKAATIAREDKKADVLGKLVTARAVHGDLRGARTMALALPQATQTQDAYRGRTQREIAAVFAKTGDFEGAMATIEEMTASFTYYSAIARTDVAAFAVKVGRLDVVEKMISEAETVAATQDNGYFSGAILRDNGFSLVKMQAMERADPVFARALAQTRSANSKQEQARSMSRLATRLADCGLAGRAGPILSEAFGLTDEIASDAMRNFSLYEIAGSAAFSGDFQRARQIIAALPSTPFGSAASLKSASQRDLSWGLARRGEVAQAVQTANAIVSKRERVHALARIVRLLNDPGMSALPRYL